MAFFVKKNKNTIFEGHNYVGKYSCVKNSKIGFGSYIGSKSSLNNCIIGKFSSVGSNVKVINGLHPTNKFVSTHPAFYSTSNASGFDFVKENKFSEYAFADSVHDVVIGNDVWIGSNVLIMAGVTVSDGAVIASGSVVTKNVEPYEIVGGVPAKRIRLRFESDVIVMLLSVRWWDWDNEKLKALAEKFDDIDKFTQYIKEHKE